VVICFEFEPTVDIMNIQLQAQVAES